jgi:Tol biopolymer transport system component
VVHWVEISPDGRWLVTRPIDEEGLWVREASDPQWLPLPNTERNSRNQHSSFSPDGSWVLVGSGQGLYRVPVTGGPSQIVADPPSFNAHWGDEEFVVFDDGRSSVYRVSSSGGSAELLFSSDTLTFRGPRLLPGGGGILVTTRPVADPLSSRLLVYDVGSGALREVIPSATAAQYVPTGHLVYSHGSGSLMAVSFDLESLRVTGTPVTLLSDLALAGNGEGQFSISETGTLVYATGRPTDRVPLAWLGLDGRLTPIPIEAERAANPRVSPDGGSIAYAGDGQIWIHDVLLGTDRQFTFGSAHAFPVWSSDGRYLYFLSDAVDGGRWTVTRRLADGTSEPEAVFDIGHVSMLTSTSPDGRWLVLNTQSQFGGGGPTGIQILDLQAEVGTPPAAFMPSETTGGEATVSPDGRWLAFLRGGEIFVRDFPEPAGLWRIADAREPVWAPDGRSLYFWAGGLQRVDIQTEPTFSAGSPTAVATEIRVPGGPSTPWDAHPDGNRFVVVGPQVSGDGNVTYYIVTNWFTELLELMGEDG